MAYIGNQPSQVAFLTDLFNGTGSQTAFTMSVAPANPASVLVAVSGVLQSPDTYSIVGTTITFTGAPPSGTGNISTRYLGIPASGVTTTAYRTVTEFTATAGQTTFTPPSYTVGFIDVLRNGVRLGSADYTATNGTTVVLTSGAVSGDLITTVSFYVSSVLNAIPATAGSVGTTYLADASITQAKLGTNVAGNGPAFSAYASSNISIPNNTFTKVAFQTEEFDTASAYDNATNYRFTPLVAGYYQVNSEIAWGATTATTGTIIAIYKNGTRFKDGNGIIGSTVWGNQNTVASLVYCNGSTDYIEVYAYQNSGGAVNVNSGGPNNTYFQACLVRSA